VVQDDAAYEKTRENEEDVDTSACRIQNLGEVRRAKMGKEAASGHVMEQDGEDYGDAPQSVEVLSSFQSVGVSQAYPFRGGPLAPTETASPVSIRSPTFNLQPIVPESLIP
jgi:hypothetical protein